MTMMPKTRLYHTGKVMRIEDQDMRYCDTCDTLRPADEVDEIIDPIYGRSHGWQCQSCSERNFEDTLSGDA